jgi:hypothetical protein
MELEYMRVENDNVAVFCAEFAPRVLIVIQTSVVRYCTRFPFTQVRIGVLQVGGFPI